MIADIAATTMAVIAILLAVLACVFAARASSPNLLDDSESAMSEACWQSARGLVLTPRGHS